jgi:membrane protease YdiL (CAAX protease family)
MIKPDVLSNSMSILAVLIAVYLSTFNLGLQILFPAILLVSGLAMQIYLLRGFKPAEPDEPIPYTRVLTGTLIAFLGFALTGLAVAATTSLRGNLFVITPMQLTGYNAMLHAILMAVAEEQFFRGAVSNYFYLLSKNTLIASLASAGIFAVYHLAVYGLAFDALTYVFIGGFLLAYVGFYVGRLSAPMLAHVLNNVMAVM